MKFVSKSWMVFLVVGVLLMSFVTMAAAKAPVVVTGVTEVSEVTQADEAPATTLPIDLPTDLAVAGPIILIVNGLVSLMKGAGVKGIWLTASSLLIGILWGIGYKYALAPLTSFSAWFWAIVFGFVLGLIACGLYDAFGNGKKSTTSTTVTQ